MKIYSDSINLYLSSRGIKNSNKGYIFLADAIRLGAETEDSVNRVSDLYTLIAMSYGVLPQNVERAIRYAISGLGVTNKEFIAKAVHEIANELVPAGAIHKKIHKKPK